MYRSTCRHYIYEKEMGGRKRERGGGGERGGERENEREKDTETEFGGRGGCNSRFISYLLGAGATSGSHLSARLARREVMNS